MWKFIYLYCIVLLIIVGCSQEKNIESAQPLPGYSVTLWTKKTELFMEYPALLTGVEGRFAVHLTWLENFKPVSEGSIQLLFASSSGNKLEVRVDKPASPGIFRPVAKFERADEYRLTVFIDGMIKDTLDVGTIKVYSELKNVPKEDESAENEPTINFLKEQQWKIDFATVPVKRKSLSGSVRASGEIIPKLKSEVIVSAPFTGLIAFDLNPDLPVIGAKINAGEKLAVLTPSVETAAGEENFASRFVRAKTALALAEKELERTKELFNGQLASQKEFQEAEAAFQRENANFKILGRYVQRFSDAQSEVSHDGSYDFSLMSPIGGTVIEMYVVPGKRVLAGEPLFRIINTSEVWLKAFVPVAEVGKLANPRDVTFVIAGFEQKFEINTMNGKLISFGSAVDEKTRTIPLIFETKNPDQKLRIGMFADVYVSTGKNDSVLSVPESALIEDEGRYSVFVHTSGESFIKRDVEIGGKDKGLVAVRNGLSEGERVVTTGAYQLRLASLSTQLPAHGHEH